MGKVKDNKNRLIIMDSEEKVVFDSQVWGSAILYHDDGIKRTNLHNYGSKSDKNVTISPLIKKEFKQELIDLPGIGPKIAEKILKLAKTKEELAKIPRKRLIAKLKDDVVIVLDSYLADN